MTCDSCGKDHAEERIVRLKDGRRVSSYSEAWRLECEVRAVLAMPDKWARIEYVVSVERKRGERGLIKLCRAIYHYLEPDVGNRFLQLLAGRIDHKLIALVAASQAESGVVTAAVR